MNRPALAWIGIAFAVYLVVLERLWFDAPLSDDYDIALGETLSMLDATSIRQWLGIVGAQHVEHRVAFARLATWMVAKTTGHIDFRILALIGDLSVLGLALLAWALFRDVVAAAVVGAAALLLMQWSYFEASLMATASLANLAVVFFSCAAVVFALREGPWAVVMCVCCAVLATGSQANGILALPLAAGASFLARRRGRALLFAVSATLLAALYFRGYVRPAWYPSPFAALGEPLAAARYFLIVIGGVLRGETQAALMGASLLGVLAWLAWRGAWRRHPAAALCVVFVMLSAAAIAAGRFGLGVPQSSRYAIYSSWLLALTFLGVCAEFPRPTRAVQGAMLACAALFSFGVSWSWWQSASDFSRSGKMLFRAIPATPDVITEDYLFTVHAHSAGVRALLAESERRGLYAPARRVVYAPTLEAIAPAAWPTRVAGALDHVQWTGRRVSIGGWSEARATMPGRVMSVRPTEPMPALARYEVAARPDVAAAFGDASFIASGFRAELEYASEEEARQAARSLCVAMGGAGVEPAVLERRDVRCRDAMKGERTP